jgi:PadR family transcriptional regulator PadR
MAEGPVRITAPLLDVLEVLLGADDFELHGWAIMKKSGRAGPTIYRMLERLAEARWVTSRWEEEVEPGKPRRRYYRLTPHGVERARSVLSERRKRPALSRYRLAFGGWTS